MRDFEGTLLQHYVPSLECQRAHSVKNSETREHPVNYTSVEIILYKKIKVTQLLLRKHVNGITFGSELKSHCNNETKISIINVF
jgi:hypothetical protein